MFVYLREVKGLVSTKDCETS